MVRYFFLLILLTLAACQTYHPLPLPDAAEGGELGQPDDSGLRLKASEFRHPLLPTVPVNLADGIGPGEAAVLAVIVSPTLQAARAARGVAAAQLFQAGVLPNPQISGSLDFVTGGVTADTITGHTYGLSWDLKALLSRNTKVRAAHSEVQSVELDLAWQEWETALQAETALYDVVAVQAQLAVQQQVEKRDADSLGAVQEAARANESSAIELGAAETTANDSKAARLALERELTQRQLALCQAIGFPPEAAIFPAKNLLLSPAPNLPALQTLLIDLGTHRLDLLALKRGYESQDATLRAAIWEQFPALNIGVTRAIDTGNVQSFGPGVALDLPIFDRNQGQIAVEKATRQRLFDEYRSRVFTACGDIAAALADLAALQKQIATAEDSLPALERLSTSYQDAQKNGGADLLSYHAAINGVAQKKLEIIKLRQELMQTRLKLETATGRFLP